MGASSYAVRVRGVLATTRLHCGSVERLQGLPDDCVSKDVQAWKIILHDIETARKIITKTLKADNFV